MSRDRDADGLASRHRRVRIVERDTDRVSAQAGEHAYQSRRRVSRCEDGCDRAADGALTGIEHAEDLGLLGLVRDANERHLGKWGSDEMVRRHTQ